MHSFTFADHEGFHRDVLGTSLGGGLGALAFWILGAQVPWLADSAWIGTLLAGGAAGIGLGLARGGVGSLLGAPVAGLAAAVAFVLVPQQAALLGGLLCGALLGLALSWRRSEGLRWSGVLGAALGGLVAAALTGGPAGDWPLWLPAGWVASGLGGLAFAFLVAFGSGAGHLRSGAAAPSAAPPLALPADLPVALRTFVDEAEQVRQRIDRVLLAHPGDPELLARIRSAAEQLAEGMLAQVRRWHEVERSVDPGAAERLAARVEELQARIDASEDATARRGFEAAREAVTAQLALHKRLGVGRERLSARLHQHLAGLEKLYLTLIELRSVDAQRFSCEVQPVLDEVGELSQDVDLVGEVNDALAALTVGVEAS